MPREVGSEYDEELVDGTPTARFAAVGRLDLVFGGARGTCTATLVAPTVALTAAHCLGFQSGREGVDRRVSFVIRERSHRVVEWRVFGAAYGPSDLALLRLAEPSPVRPLRLIAVVAPGTRVVAVGYGAARCRYDGTGSNAPPTKRYVRFAWKNDLPDLDVLCRGDSGGPLLTGDGVFALASAIRADAVDGSREDLFALVERRLGLLHGQIERWAR
jgi:hypothetical protein